MKFLKSYKDEIGSISSVVSVVAILFGVWQFYLAREALQAQAIGGSLASGRELYGDLAENPQVAADLFGATKDSVVDVVFVQKVLSFFSEQQVYHDGWLTDDKTWGAAKDDMCRNYRRPEFKAIADKLLQSGSYPERFSEVMKEC